MAEVLTADDARHWALLTRAAFAARRTEIDALNVFPVPDGDTGTNLYLTMDAAIDETVAAHDAAGILGTATLTEECRTLSRAILLSARGNSGVIVSQVVGGICQVVLDADAENIDADLLATGFGRGAELARACVAHPQEGTILTVADAVAAAARRAAVDGTVAAVAGAAVTAANDALARTPEQLEVLARAGVVDAGGAGLVLMVEALHRVVSGSWTDDAEAALGAGPALRRREGWHLSPTAEASADTPDGADGLADLPHVAGDLASYAGGPAYEVMYLLTGTDADAVATLTRTLDGLGDSLLVVGGPDLWNIHVHVDDPGAAVEAGIEAGRPHRIRITHFATQVGQVQGGSAEIAVVACSAGPGIGALMTEAGARTVDSAPGRRASAGAILDAVRATGTGAVILLPNDKDTVLAAEAASAAAGEEGIAVRVVPARTVVQGLAALAVFDPGHPLSENVLAMTSAAVATRHGAVTVAVREALTWAGVCQPGDVLGIIDGDIALIDDDLAGAARQVLDRLLAAGGELVTLVTGVDADAGLLATVQSDLHRDHAEVEVVVIDGGQGSYPILIGVE